MYHIDFRNKLEELTAVAKKHGWRIVSTDANTGRVSFADELSIFRADIYVTKMTVCLLPAGEKPVYLKRQTVEMIDRLLANPWATT